MNDNETVYELTLHDYIDILRRRALLMVASFIVVIVIASALAILLPPVYQSSGTILIESQQISTSIIESSVTGFASERIEVIKQRVMTRENLLRIIKKYNLFRSKNESRVSSELIDDLRKRIKITMLSTSTGGRRRNQATIAFSIAYEDRYAKLAYGVTNELVTLFLDENIKSRVERATETTQFLSQEAKRLKTDLEKMEALVAAYKQEHASSLPENLSLKTSILQRTETTLANLNRDYEATANELQRLELELSSAKQGMDTVETPVYRLKQLKAEYRQASINYKDTHPTIRALKRKIEMLEKGAVSEEDIATSATGALINSELALKLETLITTAKGRLESIDNQRKPMRKKIALYEKQIIETPQVELGLSSLLRDHSNAKKKYEEIQAKQLSAQIAENLEGENKSERFSLIDPPLLADIPIKPNRLKIVLMGLFIALAAAAGIAFLLEMLNQRIRGKGALTAILGESPLVEIAYITTTDERLQHKRIIKKIIIGIVIFIVVSLVTVHIAYMELDLLFYKILARL